MSDAVAAAEAPLSSRRLEYTLIGVAGLAGYFMKVPLGMLLHHIMGIHDVQKGVLAELVGNGAVQIALVVMLASLVHRSTGLPADPWLERVLYGLNKERKIWIFVPGLLGALAAMLAVGALRHVAGLIFGVDLPLEARLHAVSLSHATAVKMALLWPQTALGAGLSEEVLYRFGLLTIFAWVFQRLLPATPRFRLVALSLATLLQALFFDYAHVSEGMLQLPVGGMALQIAIAPQVWTGTILGIIYIRYGLAAAVVSHAAGDLFRIGAFVVVAFSHAHP